MFGWFDSTLRGFRWAPKIIVKELSIDNKQSARMHTLLLLGSLCWVFNITLGSPYKSCGDFRLANYYGSHMVLQRKVEDRGAVIWGFAAEVGDTVHLEIDGKQEVTTVFSGTSGRPEWRFTLEMEAGGPYRLHFRSKGCQFSIDDILFGDVWFCSGQSNMEHILSRLDNPEPDLEDVPNHPNVRAFQAARRYSDTPQHELLGINKPWALPTRQSIQSFSAICWLFGKQLSQLYNRPIGVIESDWGGTRIEAWSSPDALDVCFSGGVSPGRNPQNEASVLWNALTHPFLKMSITGALWYQGEANSGQMIAYECALQQMIADYRRRWRIRSGGNTAELFPFGVVQLAPNRDVWTNTIGLTDVRWAQSGFEGNTPTETLPNVFMAVAIDLPDFDSPYGSIHPRYKRQIADRLVLGARALAYGEDIIFRGPLPTLFVLNEGRLHITYDNGNTELEFRSVRENLFDICCSANPDATCLPTESISVWINVPIQRTSASSITLQTDSCPAGQNVVGVRYAWRESPCRVLERCLVYANNLPAPPFVKTGLKPFRL